MLEFGRGTGREEERALCQWHQPLAMGKNRRAPGTSHGEQGVLCWWWKSVEGKGNVSGVEVHQGQRRVGRRGASDQGVGGKRSVGSRGAPGRSVGGRGALGAVECQAMSRGTARC
jgi:hypothetical protein